MVWVAWILSVGLRSMTTSLTLYNNCTQSSFQDCRQVDSVYLDFSEAYRHRESHSLSLIAKLIAYNVLGSLYFDF